MLAPMGEVGRLRSDIATQIGPPDRALAALASRQHGVVAHGQLLGLGLGPGAVKHRADCGRLHRLYRGVYAVGHSGLAPRGRLMAAVMACGPGALLSHRSAAELWGLVRSAQAMTDVTVPRLGRRAPSGVLLHRPRSLPAGDRTVYDGIPVTTVARTLVDLAARARPGELERALEEAQRGQILEPTRIAEVLARSAGRRGVGALRRAVAELRDEAPATRSELEWRFLAVIRTAGLPEPALNVMVAGFMVDAAWPSRSVVAELDGYAYHGGRAAFEADRKRDTRLQMAGYRIVRITHRRLAREADELRQDLGLLLGHVGPR